MEKLFDVVAIEENAEIGVNGEVSVEDIAALEEAVIAVSETDKVEALMADSNDIAKEIEAQVSLEEAILATPEQVTDATAKMAVSATMAVAKQLGGESSIAMEDDIADPVRTMTVAVEEKRGFAKKIYDSAVILLKRLINMAKKAFAKIVMTLNGNKGALESAKTAVGKVNKFEFTKDVSETVLTNFAAYTHKDKVEFNDVVKGISLAIGTDSGKVFSKDIIKVKENVWTAIANLNPFGKRLSPVAEYITSHKDKFFGGDNLEGEFGVLCVSLTGTYVRVIVASAPSNSHLFVKTKKVTMRNFMTSSYADTNAGSSDLVKLIKQAIEQNATIKDFLNTNMNSASNALSESQKLADAADKEDAAEDDVKKVSIQLAKVKGTVGYGISMDRFKNIRDTIKLANKALAANKKNKK